MHFKLVVCLISTLCMSTFGFHTLRIAIGDILTSAKDVTVGVAKDARNLLPSPEDLFDLSKQSIAGYPFEFLSNAINKICSSALATKRIMSRITPDINKMNYQLRTACKRYTYPLLQADKMWQSPEFDPKKKVVILATGWTTTINHTNTIDVLAKAYNCRGDVNFMALDAASFVDTLYTWSAFNTEEIGKHLSKGLVQLMKIVPIENVHLMGHSLGAHIVSSAARNFHDLTGKTIPHITGLDPAKPCFNEGETLSGLLRGDADFIDVIHSNSGVLGKREPMGDIDFYPGGLDPLPPGCISIICAHEMAWKFYAETVYPGNEYNFMALRCTSLTSMRANKCKKGKKIPMGYKAPRDRKGNYFLEVNANAPYGKYGSRIRAKKLLKCGLCPV